MVKEIVKDKTSEDGMWEIVVFTLNRKHDKFVQYVRSSFHSKIIAQDEFKLSRKGSYLARSKNQSPQMREATAK